LTRLIEKQRACVWAPSLIATLIPVVGNVVVWVPAVVVPLIQREYGSALVMFSWGKLIPAVTDRVCAPGFRGVRICIRW
jgi:predicted PurR-regulated permease PerM